MIGFYIVCEKGDLEIKTILLVKSIIQHLNNSTYRINILIPDNQISLISQTIDYLCVLGCRIITFYNTLIDKNANKQIAGDRVSNKLYFLSDSNHCYSRLIFLDSDIILANIFDPNELTIPELFSAKQADRANVLLWDDIYSLFTMKCPKLKIPCSVDKIRIPPYFNSGFISVDPSAREVLFNNWTEFFLRLSSPYFLSKKLYNPFNRDQVSLALAVVKLDLNFRLLPERFNYSTKSKTPLSEALFIHYHNPISIYEIPPLKKIFIETYEESETFRSLLKRNWHWLGVSYSSFTRYFFTNPILKRITYRIV